MPGAILSFFCIYAHLIPTIVQTGNYCPYPRYHLATNTVPRDLDTHGAAHLSTSAQHTLSPVVNPQVPPGTSRKRLVSASNQPQALTHKAPESVRRKRGKGY